MAGNPAPRGVNVVCAADTDSVRPPFAVEGRISIDL